MEGVCQWPIPWTRVKKAMMMMMTVEVVSKIYRGVFVLN